MGSCLLHVHWFCGHARRAAVNQEHCLHGDDREIEMKPNHARLLKTHTPQRHTVSFNIQLANVKRPDPMPRVSQACPSSVGSRCIWSCLFYSFLIFYSLCYIFVGILLDWQSGSSYISFMVLCHLLYLCYLFARSFPWLAATLSCIYSFPFIFLGFVKLILSLEDLKVSFDV